MFLLLENIKLFQPWKLPGVPAAGTCHASPCKVVQLPFQRSKEPKSTQSGHTGIWWLTSFVDISETSVKMICLTRLKQQLMFQERKKICQGKLYYNDAASHQQWHEQIQRELEIAIENFLLFSNQGGTHLTFSQKLKENQADASRVVTVLKTKFHLNHEIAFTL